MTKKYSVSMENDEVISVEVDIVQMSEGSWPPAYAVGDQVTVLYDPQLPRNSRIKSFASTLLLWLLPAITAVVGAAFVIATLFAFKVRPLSEKEPESAWTS